MRLCFPLCVLYGIAAWAQSPADLFRQAPPAVDQALRERVNGFYQAHVEGKFRLADQYVAEDSKDVFFEAEKRRCRAFSIVRVNYADGFDKASVVINCDTEVLLPPAGLTKVTMPLASHWKLEAGRWHWYIPVRDTRESPFGSMKGGPGEEGLARVGSGPKPEDLRRMVTVDRENVTVPVNLNLRDHVRITNGMLGPVQLTLGKLEHADLRARLEKSELQPGESARLEIEFDADPKARRNPGSNEELHIHVSPTQARLLIRVQFLPDQH